jgi:hypothetical protein
MKGSLILSTLTAILAYLFLPLPYISAQDFPFVPAPITIPTDPQDPVELPSEQEEPPIQNPDPVDQGGPLEKGVLSNETVAGHEEIILQDPSPAPAISVAPTAPQRNRNVAISNNVTQAQEVTVEQPEVLGNTATAARQSDAQSLPTAIPESSSSIAVFVIAGALFVLIIGSLSYAYRSND